MKRNWETDELIESFTFLPNELSAIANKTGSNRLGFAVLFKFFQWEAHFPNNKSEIPKAVIQYIAKQLDLDPDIFNSYDWNGRSIQYHKSQVRDYFNFRVVTVADTQEVTDWLNNHISHQNVEDEHLKEQVYKKFREMKIEPPTPDRIDRLVRSVIYTYETRFFRETFNKISKDSLFKMSALIDDCISYEESDIADNSFLSFSELRNDPGRIGLESVFSEVRKLRTIQEIDLPNDLFQHVPYKVLNKYKQRAVSEDIRELRRHPEDIRYTLLAAFFWVRKMEITDNIIDLLILIIHKIGTRAERSVDREIIKDLKKVSGKTNILFRMAETALGNPEGTIKDVIYPVVNENTLRALVKEFKNTGTAYRQKVHTVMRASFNRHYRRMVPEILNVLEFRSNNEVHKPVIEALELIKKFTDTGFRYFSLLDDIPTEGIIRPIWKNFIIEKDEQGQERINRINYEICVLQALRDKLRCKEIWVIGAYRYRNPDEDLPADFEENRKDHYEALKKPMNVELLISTLKEEMTTVLTKLDKNIIKNSKVRIVSKGNGWISLSPSEPQLESQNIVKLKTEITRLWPMTSLLDILKETDLQLSFTKHFKTMATHERLDRSIIQKRLILTLYGLGTNTGLKRMASGNHGEKYQDLLYIKRKFINKDNLRNAISEIVNAILRVRMESIWGEGTTTCASDSKKFGAWDQNLMTEWHIRYRGRGVMIYWHVEKNSSCIYSQLKTCSSSEVSAMIEGLLRHCTDMEIEKNYVDTHGQSEVAFAFCYLLGFNLMPRIKSIGRQKLYRPDINLNDAFPNLQPILTRPINWDLIRQQYDQMIKYATALRLGTAETEAILKRFTRNNLKHPTYQAFAELGKVIKTIFLCRYLDSEELRIEIHKGLNVVENWNSANSFIFYGKSGEISTNRLNDQEISVLSLHLLQNCMVYINTLMIQQILSENKWYDMLTPEDFRALTPLIYNHINPYGNFDLNMDERLPLDILTN